MQPPFPSPTATWHNDTYAAIEPSNPELSQTGKTIVITGAGSGIGRATAIAFAKAGATHLALIGRTESTLRETEKLLEGSGPSTLKVSVFAASVTDEARVKEIATQIGSWNVLVLNAGHISAPSTIVNASLQSWWEDYEVNVKSIIIAAQAFIPNAKPGAAIHAVTAGALVLPPPHVPYISGYISSKVAQVKVIEYLAAENPHLLVTSVHPGMVETGIFKSSGADPTQLPMDSVELPANFLVWLSRPKAKFLHGKMVWANWDVEQLEARAEEIQAGQIMTIGCDGWPFTSAARQ